MTSLRYCSRCVLPSTRPGLSFDDHGNCNCATGKVKASIDWTARESAFRDLVAATRAKGAPYDCIIPVSGGKDSTWQTIMCLEYGLKPLCVTWRTPARSPLGQANLDNLIGLGVDHIDFSINPVVERRFMLKTLERLGSPAIPMHLALFAIPLAVARRFGIPLVVWGENSAFEYGGDDALHGPRMTRNWLLKHGVTNGTTAEDWVDDDLTARDLEPYRWPTDAELEEGAVQAVFLGHFFEWDPVRSFEVAKGRGFRALEGRPKTGYYGFADVDDEFIITIHHWLKWYKFGFTRLWDNLSLEIRNGRLSREEAISIIAGRGEEKPDPEIDLFCSYTGITRDRFFQMIEKFRNPRIWNKDQAGRWKIGDFLITDWNWS
ncbi:N-acetyl sugar amidotransferase (plasmid) [Azospirillum sp. A29]|uniref:N-acetyl sugar amidotransferase n=1 Tax=Azospirillum sp. A29 TaxID=3160606 RepID=UPI003670AA3B